MGDTGSTPDRHAAELARQVRHLGVSAGLSRVGITTAESFPDVIESVFAMRDEGRAGGLGFTFRRPEVSGDVRRSIPWAESLVTGGFAYLPAAGHPGPSKTGRGRIARFATDDHYRGLREALETVASALRSAGHRATLLVDDNRLVDRAAAVRSGIGWWGRNTMVIAPGEGPWMLLGSVATEASLPVDAPMKRDCGSCHACEPACPTGALAGGQLDARRCISAVLQQPESIPVDMREAVGDRFYGCDECLDACPPGGRLSDSSERLTGSVDLGTLLQADDDTLMDRYGRFYVPRRDPRYLRRNAIVALGNSGDGEALPVLIDIATGGDELLAEHARWAIGQIERRSLGQGDPRGK